MGITGYGVIESNSGGFQVLAAGVVQTLSKIPLEQRLMTLHSALESLLKEHCPAVLVLEELYSHSRHPATAITMAHARGVVCLAAARQGIPVVGYAARRVKQVITGNGAADKSQVNRMIEFHLNWRDPEAPLDVTDALSLGLTYLRLQETQSRMGRVLSESLRR